MGLIPVWAWLIDQCANAARGVLASAEAALTSVPVSVFTRKRSDITWVTKGDDRKRRFYPASVFIAFLNSDRRSFRYRIDPPAGFKVLSS